MMNKNQIIPFVLLIVCLFTSCKWIERRRMGNIVAQVGDKVLYESEVSRFVPVGTSPEDSLRIVNQYIYQWSTKQLLYKRAVQNSDYKDEFEAMVDDYRRQLYVHEYEQNILQRRQIDSITDATLMEYFEAHHELFRLKDNYVKGMFVIMPRESKDVNVLISLLRNPTDENMPEIESYLYEKSLGYSLFTDHWQAFSELKVHLPLKTTDDSEWLRQNSFVTLEDTTKTYVLRIVDRIFTGDEMPFEIAKPVVKDVIENGQRISTLKAIEQELYNDGIRRGDIFLRDTRSLEEQIAALPKPQEVKESTPSQEVTKPVQENVIIEQKNEQSNSTPAAGNHQKNDSASAESNKEETVAEPTEQVAESEQKVEPEPAPTPTPTPAPAPAPQKEPEPAKDEKPQQQPTFDFNVFD